MPLDSMIQFDLELALDDLASDDIVLLQESASLAMPEFGASCCPPYESCGSCDNQCVVEESGWTAPSRL